MTSLALSRLGERETAAIITHLVGNKDLPADVMAEIVERTDGIPLFVEEMTKAVLEAKGEGEVRHASAAVLCLTAATTDQERRTAVERQQWGKLSLFIRQLCSLLFQFG